MNTSENLMRATPLNACKAYVQCGSTASAQGWFDNGGFARVLRKRRRILTTIGAAVLIGSNVCTTIIADARVTRFVVEQRQPYAGGAQFGDAGTFERLVGTASFEVDPNDPLNAVIVNLDKAPRNARGMVEFTAPFWIVKPVDMSRGNQKIWYAINNRGNSDLAFALQAEAKSSPFFTSDGTEVTSDIKEDQGALTITFTISLKLKHPLKFNHAVD